MQLIYYLIRIVDESGSERVATFQLVIRKHSQPNKTHENVDSKKERNLEENSSERIELCSILL